MYVNCQQFVGNKNLCFCNGLPGQGCMLDSGLGEVAIVNVILKVVDM